ncbi:MAG: MFS transporter [Haliscomenobacteraceae bacterium CHB4]|nr:putative niacin/nicotinamide transporter NaiP [Saprospiraceae bacterium]MCE7922105.1 MFS transporter [Haliscomenobacteraceae bacterium CHB4]
MNEKISPSQPIKILNAAVIVAALGYFVDIYDLLLFGFVRVKSLTDLGFSGQELTDKGLSLQNWQMGGMLIGGILWGVLGDKLGRVRVLYFSIALYSIANILNGFATGYGDYAFYRLIAGIGLAGELGAGITLVSEVLPKNKRGIGTMLVASIGLSGALLAWIIEYFFEWRTCYFIGGGLGVLLLIVRISVSESGIFRNVQAQTHISRGNFFALFNNWERFTRFLRCIFIGTTTWFVVGILVMLAPEFGKVKGLEGITAPNAIAICYSGLILGDLVSGLLSQLMRSRVKVMALFLALDLVAILAYLALPFSSPAMFYASHFLLGFSVGFWVIFVTIGAEQFGTNLRSTVATSVPNFARGMQVPINESFKYLKGAAVTGSVITAGYIVGAVCLGIAFLALWGMKDTFNRDMDYVEEI